MKVGKPKSKRVPVRLRHKIEKASAAKQKKQRKEAKKNPQWRSRLKKDPGIPNLFPFKAQMLAELEEKKRAKEEEQLRKREIAKAQREGRAVVEVQQKGTAQDAEDDDEVLVDQGESADEGDDAMDEQDDNNPMAALLASAQARANAYGPEKDDDDEEESEDDEEWGGIEDTSRTTATTQPARKALPKQALADPIKAISALLERLQKTTEGIQKLVEYYQIPPLMTGGNESTSPFLVEVARKRGRLGRGGVPNLHSAALIVLNDVNEERLALPAASLEVKKSVVSKDGEVKIVSKMSEPFKLEGLWEADADDGGVAVDEMVVEHS